MSRQLSVPFLGEVGADSSETSAQSGTMDLLTLVGQVTKKRADYFSQAEVLARKAKTQEKLESLMTDQSKVLVKALRDKDIRWDEYSRTLIDKTLSAALAAVYLGAGKASPQAKVERAWGTVTGQMLPPLLEFLSQTELALNDGTLMLGDDRINFSEIDLEDMYEGGEEVLPPKPKMSWLSLVTRVVRYLANPSYSFFNLGDSYVKQEQGYREMRRVPVLDTRTCPDCIKFGEKGWQPFGTLPMPGQECRCYDRCRCRIDYR